MKKASNLLLILTLLMVCSCHKKNTKAIVNANTTASDSLLSQSSKYYFQKAKTFEFASDSALYYLDKAIAENHNINKKDLEDSDALFYETIIRLHQKNEYQKAIAYDTLMLSYFKVNSKWSHWSLSPIYTSLAKSYLMTGRYDLSLQQAVLPNETLLDSLTSVQNLTKDQTLFLHNGKIANYNFMVLNYDNLGDKKQVLATLKKLESTIHTIELDASLKPYLEDVYSTLIDNFIELKEHQKAAIYINNYQKLYTTPSYLTQLRILDKKRKLAFANYNESEVISLHNKAFAMYQASDKSPDIIHYFKLSLEHYAAVMQKQNNFEEAIKTHKDIAQLIPEHKQTPYTNPMYSYFTLVELFETQKVTDSVIKYNDLAESIAKKFQLNEGLIKANINKAELFVNQNHLKSIKTITAQTCQLINVSLEAFTYSKDLKIVSSPVALDAMLSLANINHTVYQHTKNLSFLKDAHNLYSISANILHQLKYARTFNDAQLKQLQTITNGILDTQHILLQHKVPVSIETNLEIMERHLGLELLLKNQLDYIVFENKNIPEALIQKKKALELQLLNTKNELHSLNTITTNQDKVKDLQAKQHSIELALSSIYEDIFQKNQLYKTYHQPNVDIKNIRTSLDSATAIVRFLVSDTNVYAYIISKDKTELQHIESSDTFMEKLSKQYELWSSTSITKLNETGLFESKFIDQLSKYKTLTVIPHHNLHTIPFEALKRSNQQYLMETTTISYANSLVNFAFHQANKRIGADQLKVAGFAPSYTNDTTSLTRTQFTSLKNAKKEAATITKLFNGDLYEGEKANKRMFVNRAGQYHVLHLAMHSSYNTTNGDITLGFSSSEKDLLNLNDIYNLNLNAQLTVLSACDTGLGANNSSEGVLSLSRAFQYAGSSATLMSLWKVPDAETSKIMMRFYQHLAKGTPKDEALKLAKLDYLNETDDPKLKQPYYWAGFVISGDPTELPTNNDWYWIALVALLIGAGFYYWHKKNPKASAASGFK